MKVAAAHLDDGAETAIEGAAARRLDCVDLPTQHRVSTEHAGIAVRRPNLAVFEAVRRPRGVVQPALAVLVGEAADPLESGLLLERAQQFAKGDFALAAH